MANFISRRWRALTLVPCGPLAIALSVSTPSVAGAQPSSTLSIAEARSNARRVSPDLVASREAVSAARGRERQAGAFQNPAFVFDREQSSGGGQSNSQSIAVIEQPVEFPGLRSARRAAATARRQAAEARLGVDEREVDYEVTRAYALAVAADRRAALATQAAATFTEALRVSDQRLAAGDLSGYSHRRLKLEAARYATLRVEGILAQRAARTSLASLVAPSADSIGVLRVILTDSLTARAEPLAGDSLLAVALRTRGELIAAQFDAAAAAAEARLAGTERIPTPVLSGGLKTERLATAIAASQDLGGFVVGVSLPLPLWDRRNGAMQAAAAESRRRMAETEVQRRRVSREVAEAYDAYRAIDEQIALLAPQLGAESSAALRAALVAYTEGEIALVEWLDAVRAYREAEASFAALQSELIIRRAALERAVGTPLLPLTSMSPTAPRSGAAAFSGLDR